MTAPKYLTAQARWHRRTRALAAFHERYDLLLTPTTARQAWPIGEFDLARPIQLAARGLLKARAGGLLGRINLVEKLSESNLEPARHLVCGIEHAVRIGTPEDRPAPQEVLLRGIRPAGA